MRVEVKIFHDSSGGGRRLIHIRHSFTSSWHMCYYRQEASSSWRLLTPLGCEHLLPPSSTITSSPSLAETEWCYLASARSPSGQSSFQHPSTLSWKEALNISLQLLITCSNSPWKCVCFFPPPSLSLVIGSYSCRVVRRDDGNAAANAHPLPAWASLSHKAAVQPGGGIIFVCVDRYCSSKPLGGFAHREQRCVYFSAGFLRAGDNKASLEMLNCGSVWKPSEEHNSKMQDVMGVREMAGCNYFWRVKHNKRAEGWCSYSESSHELKGQFTQITKTKPLSCTSPEALSHPGFLVLQSTWIQSAEKLYMKMSARKRVFPERNPPCVWDNPLF